MKTLITKCKNCGCIISGKVVQGDVQLLLDELKNIALIQAIFLYSVLADWCGKYSTNFNK